MIINKDVLRAQKVVPLLYETFHNPDQGIFGHTEMPEDLQPSGIQRGSYEHLMFITMTTSIDYQRDADQLWDAGRKTMEDQEVSWVFIPAEVMRRTDREIVEALHKHHMSKKDTQDALKIWKPVAASFLKMYHGDPRILFQEQQYDALRIYDVLQSRYKTSFPFLSGRKILPLWIRMVHDVVGIDFINMDTIPIPVDRHIARATLRLGCLRGSYKGSIGGIFQEIASIWREACQGLAYYPLQLDQPLWNLSRYGCVHKKNGDCVRSHECRFSDFCIDGEVNIDDKGAVIMNTGSISTHQAEQVSTKQLNQETYRWCPTTGILWTACSCPRCNNRRSQHSESTIAVSNQSALDINDNERLWKDVCQFVDKKLQDGDTIMYTNPQNKKFWVVAVTSSYIRVNREKSKLPYEDIPKSDFLDIWRDMHKSQYISRGYSQKDLHGGQNRHTAVTFALISKIPYIETRKINSGLRYYIKKGVGNE